MTSDQLKVQYLRAKAVEYAWTFLGLPYHWGGDDPIRGLDCSGLVIEVLQGVGVLPANFDTTANGLYIRFSPRVVAKGYAGCLVFWFNSQAVATHVELMIDEFLVLGASGGGSAVKTLQDAADKNAFVKIRPLNYRGVNYKIADPFKVAG